VIRWDNRKPNSTHMAVAPPIEYSQHWVRVGLLLMALLILISRLPTFSEAFERDLMIYMTIADGLLHGRALYADLFDIKPPGVYWTYALFEDFFGPSPLAIFLMGVSCSWLTLWGCYAAVRSTAGPLGGLMAAMVWTVISGDLALQANQPNTEAFVNACLSCSFALFMGATPSHRSLRRFVMLGLIFFLASLFKQVSLAVTVIVLTVYVLLAPWIARPDEDKPGANLWDCYKTAIIQSLLAGTVVVIGWVLVAEYFYWQGNFSAFKETLVDYGHDYAGDVVANVLIFFVKPLNFLQKSLDTYCYLLLAALSTTLAGIYFWKDRELRLALWMAYCLGAIIAIALPGCFYQHYFQLWLPPAAMGAGWLLYKSLAKGRMLGTGLILASLLPILCLRIYQSTIPSDQIPLYKYGDEHGPEALESKKIGLWIKENIDPNVLVYEWGAEPGVYFWAQRPCPVGLVTNYPLMMGSPNFIARFTNKLLQQLKQLRPPLIVANKQALVQGNYVLEWLAANYMEAPINLDIKRFVVLVPK